MLFSFRSTAAGLAHVRFVIERDRLDACGDLETPFLAAAGNLARHPSRTTGQMVMTLAAEPETEALVVIRNPDLVLDAGLPGRIATALEALAALDGPWSLAAAGGLTASGDRVAALYATETPFLPAETRPQPLTDPLPDLWIAEAGWIRSLAMAGRRLPDSGLEAVLCLEGYLEDRVALFLPGLAAGVNGGLRPRDPVKLERDLRDWFAETLTGETVPTLMGAVRIEPPERDRDDPRPPDPDLDLAGAIARVVRAHCPPLDLSIVTRTRFRRPHLLDRLLTSISRARPEEGRIEVVLSTDADKRTCEREIARLRRAFVNLDIRLQRNRRRGHSRVTNLIAGLKAATGTHVAVMDDDDYVDLFAFDTMRQALFLGASPLMITASQVHEETWIEAPSGRHVLTDSVARTAYPAEGWRAMFGGVNALPVCAMVMPRARLVARLGAFDFRHDLSEDYALALLVLTDPELPEIVELPGTFGHISLRPGEGHSISVRDRRPWARDIALYLADLVQSRKVAGPGKWALLAHGQPVGGGAGGEVNRRVIEDLRTALSRAERQLRLLAVENARLRGESQVPASAEPVAVADRAPEDRAA